jgi:hypothetical protein
LHAPLFPCTPPVERLNFARGSFTSLYSYAERNVTKFAIFGDMVGALETALQLSGTAPRLVRVLTGLVLVSASALQGVYTYNNMDGLQTDAEAGDIDFIIHLGDHAVRLWCALPSRGATGAV